MKSRRDKSKSPHEPLERSLGRSKGGFTQDDAVISRYFTSTEDSLPYRPGPELDLSASSNQRCHGMEGVQFPRERCSIKGKALLPLLELPEKPFLGFGSSGFSMSSPVKLRTPLKTPHRATHSPAPLTSPTPSTTYFTWSRSGAVSRGSLPLGSASNLSPRSGLSNECQPHRAPAGHVHAVRHEDVQVECFSGYDDAPGQCEAILSAVEDQARNSAIGPRLGQAQQPISIYARSREPPSENGKEDNGKTLGNVHNQGFSANGSTKTSLAEKTLVASLDVPLVSSHPGRKNTASPKSSDAAFDRTIHQCTETPSRQITNSRYQAAVHSGAEKKGANGKADGKASGYAGAPGHEIQDSPVLLADPTSAFEPSSPPSAPTIQPPPILFSQSGTSLGSSSSMACLSRDLRSYEHKDHRVPLSKIPTPRTCVMRRSPIQGTNAWHGYDNMYERQDIHRYNLSSCSAGNMQRYTPVKTPRSKEFIAREGHFSRPNHGLNPCRRREKMEFQQPEKHSSSTGNPLNQYSENLRGTRSRYINSPAFHNLAANVGDDEDGEPQAYEEHSHDEQFDAADDTRPDLGQKCPLQSRFDVFRRPGVLATQDYPLFEPYFPDSPLPWNQATPSHTPRFRRGFIESSNRPRLDQDEEGQLADFWKPNLLY